MNLKKIAATVTMAGALGLNALGTAGSAQAGPDDDWVPWPNPPGPGWLPPPGHIGQITGVPPGHWDDVLPGVKFCKHLNPGCINHL